ncbi:MAG TPA: flagellar hook capping FlgD N-terminal domain-containing protein [Terriglobales bacterium]|jgi:flagellar basal-body rod modification protein FlgD
MIVSPFATSQAATAHASSGTGSSDPSSPLGSTDGMFLQLLTTQLKNQSPLDPMDPDQFTTELVQFNMLDQLSQINGFLQGSTIAPAAPDPSSSNAASANANSSIQKTGAN